MVISVELNEVGAWARGKCTILSETAFIQLPINCCGEVARYCVPKRRRHTVIASIKVSDVIGDHDRELFARLHSEYGAVAS